MASSVDYGGFREEKEVEEYEDPPEIVALRRLRPDFIHAIIPAHIIPYLGTCLSLQEEEKILAENRNEGNITGSIKLLEFLLKKGNWYETLLTALEHEEIKLGHLASALKEEVSVCKRANRMTRSMRSMTFGSSYSEDSTDGDLESANPSSTTASKNSQDSHPKTQGLYMEDTSKNLAGTSQLIPDEPPPPYSEVVASYEGTGTHKMVAAGLQQQGEEESSKARNMAEAVKDDISDKATDDGLSLTTKDKPSDGTASTSHSTTRSMTKIEYGELELRGYQEELVKPALEGHNCIICAPTGTGKTHVAMGIIKHRLDQLLVLQAKQSAANLKNTQYKKVIVLVNRIPLLNQTYKRFKKYFPLLNIAKRSGASKASKDFEMLVPLNDIIITTGGILKNTLEEKKITLDQFSLIIIDECHHAIKNHAYNVVMTEYLRVKLSNTSTQLPQVVGLTASPGAGSKSCLIAVTDHILKLCANLDAQMFVTVRDEKNKEELRNITKDPDKYTTETHPREPDPFKEKVEEIMAEIEMKARLSGCGQRGSQQYETYIMEELNSATNQQRHNDAICCEHLKEYNTALQMNSICRMTDALDIIDSFYNDREKRGQHKGTEIEKWLYKLFRKNSSCLFDISEDEDTYPNPKVVKLKETLTDEIEQKEGDLRGIIFVKTRKCAKAICECIKEDQTLAILKPIIVTGVQAKVEGRMTQSEQDSALKKFADGTCKLVVATSVAEEGLDIPECHMVIRYNYATNEISMRQARGRARAEQSTEHIIGDTELLLKDKVNVFLDQQVERAVPLIQNMSEAEFIQKVEIIQHSTVADRTHKERLQQLKRSANDADSVKLFCRGCNIYVCQGDDILKNVSDHFIKDKEIIESMIEFREHTDEKKRNEGLMKIYCKHCRHDWGYAMAQPQPFPIIKIKSFIVEYANGKRKLPKQWKAADFEPQLVDRLPIADFTVNIIK